MTAQFSVFVSEQSDQAVTLPSRTLLREPTKYCRCFSFVVGRHQSIKVSYQWEDHLSVRKHLD